MTIGCPHVAAAHGYARDVVAGTIPACRWIVITCRRHLDDLARQDDPDFPYRFDERKASKVCKFVQLTALMNEGIPCIEVRPLVLNFSEPMKQMEGLIRSRAIAHAADPVFTWMLSNVVAKPDAKDNVYPRKERAENKIDGPVAHMMALARHMSGEEQGGGKGFVEV